ncbi:hypothetical protein [Christiangramia forsetii]|uniref:hypothetical protein n=1 Tax=Christiangramia forsetii TaxID=411153 RepID=UPI0011D2A41E|nr:hypothetical protein [Christiangramia forsetii]
MKDYPLYVTSISKPTQVLFIFRDNGQQIKVSLTGDQPVGEYALTPEERMHILDNFYKNK